MRSSIFDPEPKRALGPSRTSLLRSRASSASPNLKASTIKASPKLDPKRTTPKLYQDGNSDNAIDAKAVSSDRERTVAWNLDDMVHAYQEYKLLPPILSPTLPEPIFEIPDLLDKPNEDISDIPLAQFAPRLSPIKLVESTNSSEPSVKYNSDKSSSKSHSPVKNSNADKPDDGKQSAELKSKAKRARVKWVNRMEDSNPRFLIRFLYNADKFQKIKPVTGLGISGHSNKASPIKQGRMSTPATPKPPLRPSPQKGSKQPTPKASKLHDDDYIKHKTHWLKLAKESKFMASQTEGILSLLIEFDSLILYTIAYDYDDKLKQKMNLMPLDRYWFTLITEVKATISKIDSTYLESSKHEPIRNYLRCFMSLLNKFVIIILQKVNATYSHFIDKESEVVKKSNLQAKIINNHNIIQEIFQASEILCPNIEFFLKANFPRVWANRIKNLGDLESGEYLVPITNNYYLPVNHYTTISEFVNLFHNLTGDFIVAYNNIFRENLMYGLKSGLNGP